MILARKYVKFLFQDDQGKQKDRWIPNDNLTEEEQKVVNKWKSQNPTVNIYYNSFVLNVPNSLQLLKSIVSKYKIRHILNLLNSFATNMHSHQKL